MKKWASLLAGIALVATCNLGYAQNTSPAPKPADGSGPGAVGVTNGAATADATAKAGEWVNISDDFIKQIGADVNKTPYLNRCQGLMVTPSGDLVMLIAGKGICISKDQGATWAVVADNGVTGRCEHGSAFAIDYPYTGRMAIFAYDGGRWGTSGGMSLDGGKTWKSFTTVQRGTEYGDVYWDTHDSQATYGSQTVYAVTHEPYYTLLSDDSGRSWQRLDLAETGKKTDMASFSVGIINPKTLVHFNANKDGGIIEISEDAGKTWNKVSADFHVTARSVVHYGQKVYWTTTKGVITSTDGKDWTLTGPGAEGAAYGPYFGASDQEFVVVTDKSFLKTEDGGKTWKPIAGIFKAPDIFHHFAGYSYFGWDSKHNILYTSGLGASVYKLPLDGDKTKADSANQ